MIPYGKKRKKICPSSSNVAGTLIFPSLLSPFFLPEGERINFSLHPSSFLPSKSAKKWKSLLPIFFLVSPNLSPTKEKCIYRKQSKKVFSSLMPGGNTDGVPSPPSNQKSPLFCKRESTACKSLGKKSLSKNCGSCGCLLRYVELKKKNRLVNFSVGCRLVALCSW